MASSRSFATRCPAERKDRSRETFKVLDHGWQPMPNFRNQEGLTAWTDRHCMELCREIQKLYLSGLRSRCLPSHSGLCMYGRSLG
jgi:hypothetical protein